MSKSSFLTFPLTRGIFNKPPIIISKLLRLLRPKFETTQRNLHFKKCILEGCLSPCLCNAWLHTCKFTHSNSQVILQVLDLGVFSACQIEVSAQIASKFKFLPYLCCSEGWWGSPQPWDAALPFLFNSQDGLAGGRSPGVDLGFFSGDIRQGEASPLHVLQPPCFSCGSLCMCRLTFPHQWSLAGPPNFLTFMPRCLMLQTGSLFLLYLEARAQNSHWFP